MTKAYLQNKKAQYYYIAGDGSIALRDEKKALQTAPEMVELAEETTSINKNYTESEQTVFVFTNDGCRILSYLFFTKGTEADCILTLEEGEFICGNLDFSTARIFGRKKNKDKLHSFLSNCADA